MKNGSESIVMNNSLTTTKELIIIPLVGEMEAGSAEVQPARDSQLKATNCRGEGSFTLAVPFYQGPETTQSFLMPKKTSLPKARLSSFGFAQDRLNCKEDLSNSR